MKCMRQGCANDAAWQVTWKIWPQHENKVIMVPAVVQSGLIVCDDHRAAVNMEELCPPAEHTKINNKLRANKRQPLDFTTAKPEFVPIIGDQLPIAPPPKASALRIT